MLLYLYMIVQTILSFVLVGLFFGSFSLFVREVLPSHACPNKIKVGNVVEYIYVIFLFA